MIQDYKYMLDAYAEAGGSPEAFKNSKVAHLVVHQNKVIGEHLVDGLDLKPRETASGVDIHLIVIKGAIIKYPVHLCFGVLPKEGIQEINIRARGKMIQGLSYLHIAFSPML